MAKLIQNGYGQLELNQVAFPRDGRIEAQCALYEIKNPEDESIGFGFDADGKEVPAENGMILVVDNVTRTIKKTTKEGGNPGEIFALNYTTEHMYDDRDLGSLRKFKLLPGTFYPRLGYLAVGDKFTTNTVVHDKAITEGNYAVPNVDGYWKIVETYPTEAIVVAQVIKNTTMPDGQKAVKLQVVKA